MALQWCHQTRQEWSSLAGKIWELTTRNLESIADNIRRYQLESKDRREIFERFTITTRLTKSGKREAPKFARDIVAALGDPKRLIRIRHTVSDLCTEIEKKFSEIQLTHTQDDYRFEISELYVDRTLKRRSDDEIISAESILSPEHQSPRVVVLGHPGVGKTTLVRHLIHSTIDELNSRVAPLLFQCREYAGSHWGSSFNNFLRVKISVECSLELQDDELEDILSTGSASIIFDGVDEITDIQKRREMIRKIESFSRRYPLVHVLATSRLVGYQRAQFQPNYFKLYELEEFTHNQFLEYVIRWFRITHRAEDEQWAFIRESEVVPDIRRNPLILSLLCALYRARGHIPRNRRQVYKDCTDLLFQRWDSMRQIEQPFDHRQYGQRLMQELARFFYRSQNAQAGIEEEQLKRLISHFFQDTAGIEPPESHSRAEMFLDFCADRAWLLSAKGTSSRGQRLFSFTHRTFMEYMAAEALVRNADNINEIVDEVIRVYESDPSSVLADVMVQCSEDKVNRGAEQILIELLRRARKVARYGDSYLSLCLRIVNSSPMSARISSDLPKSVHDFWKRLDGMDKTRVSSVAFFELYRDPRRRMIRAMSEDNPIEGLPSTEFRHSVCGRWARFDSLGLTHHFEPEWEEELSPHFTTVANDIREGLFARSSSSLVNYLISRSEFEVSEFTEDGPIRPDWIVPTFDEYGPGALMTAVIEALHDERARVDILAWLSKYLERNRYIETNLAKAVSYILDDEIRFHSRLSRRDIERQASKVEPLREILLWLAFITCEARDNTITMFHEMVDGVIGLQNFANIVATRESRLGLYSESLEAKVLSRKQATALVADFPAWAKNWVNGARLVKELG
ncbi:P-loop containing NTPase [Amycolatopsis decaplanina DSM 44594]|uniref:p-loop containing NTPase n=2 Tax=Amycolatopsis decaplanina TaxID=208441 RepID=M2YVM5_9PSEU|nr:P-loop containing NTPase [Amycolatopsis decaplanina DSM 44594]